MDRLNRLGQYVRLLWSVPGILRTRITLPQARAIVEQRLLEREANFLQLIEQRIFAHPRSPYLPLFKLAGCELGDVRIMVQREGVDATLRALLDAGVYVTFEEFKGRTPIVRRGQKFHVQPHDFDNPLVSALYQAESSGSSGAAVAVPISRYHHLDHAPIEMLVRDAHDVLDVPTALWRPILPASTGIGQVLRPAYYGRIPTRWFSPVNRRDLTRSQYGLATLGIAAIGRLCGAAFPWPEPVPLEQAVVVARWAAQAVQEHHACLVRTYVSSALRVSIAAQQHGLDLSGVAFFGGGEPPSEAKVRGIERSGARWIPSYGMTETGTVGAPCVHPADGNDLHLLHDIVGLIQRPRSLPESDLTVNAFYFTTLLPSAPKVMLNAESDDFGVVEERRCGCPLEQLGYTKHLRHIRSFSKLTAEGMTVAGNTMVRILEEVLPARFGGTPVDYQLVEEQDEEGFTRLNLLVNPSVDLEDEDQVLQAVLGALKQSEPGENLGRAIWQAAETIRIRRAKPIWSPRGKFLPLLRHQTLHGDTMRGE